MANRNYHNIPSYSHFHKRFCFKATVYLMAEKNIEQLHLCSEDSSLIKEPVLRVQSEGSAIICIILVCQYVH